MSTLEEVFSLTAHDVRDLYNDFINPGQVNLLTAFGPGRDTVTHAEGINITLDNGRIIKDFTGGIGVLNLGHNHPRILAVRRQFNADRRMEVHKNYLSPAVALLGKEVSNLFYGKLPVSYFCNSGAEAVEGAIKMAYQAHDGGRKLVACSDMAFHGKLIGAGSLTSSPEVSIEFPKVPGVVRFEYC
ncbi:MAG: aminotransferase class III-fold pyridoxal phosphate-dependent enzyme, partial [Pseudomonadota bacterium]|nr:aminotransferase class III-fold pyridoxal phosphate-dependent enzyme [Pseudomonadota bacterium]